MSAVPLFHVTSAVVHAATLGAHHIRSIIRSGRNIAQGAVDKSVVAAAARGNPSKEQQSAAEGATGSGSGIASFEDPQTLADRETEMLIIGSLAKEFPGITIVGEENQSSFDTALLRPLDREYLAMRYPGVAEAITLTAPLSEYCIWVDPLDGTKSFTQGNFDSVTCMIGVAVRGAAVSGVIARPFGSSGGGGSGEGSKTQQSSDEGSNEGVEVFWGAVGAGAFGPNGAALVPSAVETPEDAGLVASASRFFLETCGFVRCLGPKELNIHSGAGNKMLQVIENHSQLYAIGGDGVSRWDTCAGDAILRAMGGGFLDLTGRPYDYSSPYIGPTAATAAPTPTTTTPAAASSPRQRRSCVNLHGGVGAANGALLSAAMRRLQLLHCLVDARGDYITAEWLWQRLPSACKALQLPPPHPWSICGSGAAWHLKAQTVAASFAAFTGAAPPSTGAAANDAVAAPGASALEAKEAEGAETASSVVQGFTVGASEEFHTLTAHCSALPRFPAVIAATVAPNLGQAPLQWLMNRLRGRWNKFLSSLPTVPPSIARRIAAYVDGLQRHCLSDIKGSGGVGEVVMEGEQADAAAVAAAAASSAGAFTFVLRPSAAAMEKKGTGAGSGADRDESGVSAPAWAVAAAKTEETFLERLQQQSDARDVVALPLYTQAEAACPWRLLVFSSMEGEGKEAATKDGSDAAARSSAIAALHQLAAFHDICAAWEAEAADAKETGNGASGVLAPAWEAVPFPAHPLHCSDDMMGALTPKEQEVAAAALAGPYCGLVHGNLSAHSLQHRPASRPFLHEVGFARNSAYAWDVARYLVTSVPLNTLQSHWRELSSSYFHCNKRLKAGGGTEATFLAMVQVGMKLQGLRAQALHGISPFQGPSAAKSREESIVWSFGAAAAAADAVILTGNSLKQWCLALLLEE